MMLLMLFSMRLQRFGLSSFIWKTILCSGRPSLTWSARAGPDQAALSATASTTASFRAIALSFRASRARSWRGQDLHPRARIELHALEAPQVLGHHVEGRRPRRLGTRARPARGPVTPIGSQRLAVHRDRADSPAHAFAGIDGVGDTADPHHVAPLTIVRIWVEEVVGDVLHEPVDLGPAELADEAVRVAEPGVRVHVLERDLLPRHDGDPPPEPWGEGDLGVEALEQRVQDDLVEAPVEVAAPVEEALRDGQPLPELRLVGRAELADEPRHLRILRD